MWHKLLRAHNVRHQAAVAVDRWPTDPIPLKFLRRRCCVVSVAVHRYYYININIATPTRTCMRDSHSRSPTPSPLRTALEPLILRYPSPIAHVCCKGTYRSTPWRRSYNIYVYYITDNCDPRGFQQQNCGYRRITRIYYY